MRSVNVLDARNSLSKLVTAASEGEDIVISKRGRPLVRLVPVADESSRFTGEQAARWLTTHPAPAYSSRSTDELDAQIAEERAAWE
ncbi:MAG: type toxin-antitoxin system prevent-host-death family antitoxin [Subtercola sp.]|nr:type toxin-antitoxin system prevent-host-death family antitoxin [Subtercola sp.]